MRNRQCKMGQVKENDIGKNMKSGGLFHRALFLGVLFLGAVLVSGCGGGGGGASAVPLTGGGSSTNLLSGSFVDSPVEGLQYETETQFGMTNANGTFMYRVGENVTFHVGDIVLGQAPARPLMTPIDLVEGATDVTHPMVTNMARLLQTLDADMNPENGITITEEMATAMENRMIDFNMDPAAFEQYPNVRMLMETVNGIRPSGTFRMLVSSQNAQDHLRNTMNGMTSGNSGVGTDNGMSGNDNSSAGLLKGSFVDSPVEGLEYETETQFGMTDANGTFMYRAGENVTFHVGDIVLGQAPGRPLMTPIDLVEGATDVTHPMVTNMMRFLQTLDADNDPENGITITEEMATAMENRMIDFNMDPAAFEYDPNVRMFMETVNGMAASDTFRIMVSSEDAQSHFRNTMNAMTSDNSGMGTNNGMTGNNTGIVQGDTNMTGGNTGMGPSGNGMMN